MAHPFWLLIPWAVFSIALGLKLWRFSALIRQQLLGRSRRVDLFRQRLERIWEQR